MAINAVQRIWRFLDRKRVYEQYDAMVSYLIPHRSDVKLILRIGGGSLTDWKKIIVGIDEEFSEMTDEELFTIGRALVGHECQHNVSTDGKEWTRFLEDAEKHYKETGHIISKSKDAGTWLISSEEVGKVVKDILNIVEDARIEKILGNKLPGYVKYLQFLNGKYWERIKIDGNSELQDFLATMWGITAVGIPPKGYKETYEGTELEENIELIWKDLIRGINAVTFKECTLIVRKIITKVEPYLLKLLKEQDRETQEFLNSLPNLSEVEFKVSDEKEMNNSRSITIHFKPEPPTDDKEDDDKKNKGSGKEEESEKEDREGSDKGNDKKDSSKSSESGDESKKNDDESMKNGNSAKKSSKEDSENEGSGSKASDSKEESGLESSSGDSSGDSKDKADSDKKESSERSGSEKDSSKDSDSKTKEDPDGKSPEKEEDSEGRSKDGKHSPHAGSGGQGKSTGFEENGVDDEKLITARLKQIEEHVLDDAKRMLEEKPLASEKQAQDKEITSSEINKMIELNYKSESKRQFEEIKGFDFKYELPEPLKQESRRFRIEIERLLKNKEAMTLRGQRRGVMDANSLWKLGAKDPHIFVKKGVPITTDYVFYLLQDGSGSMSQQGKQLYSSNALAVLEEGLKGLVPLKITQFTVLGHRIVHFKIKDFSESNSRNYSHNFNQQHKASGGNKDGYSIRVATRELLKRSERDKVLVILSDGIPTDYSGGTQAGMQDVKAAVSEARAKGIMVVSVMFGTEIFRDSSIEDYKMMYGKNIISCDPLQINTQLIRLFRKIMAR